MGLKLIYYVLIMLLNLSVYSPLKWGQFLIIYCWGNKLVNNHKVLRMVTAIWKENP